MVTTRILLIPDFAKFVRKERISEATLVDAIERVERGLIDADLGGDLLKLRVARTGEGRSGGYRTVVACRVGETAYFLLGFAKADLSNIGSTMLADLRRTGNGFLALNESEINQAKAEGQITEIER